VYCFACWLVGSLVTKFVIVARRPVRTEVSMAAWLRFALREYFLVDTSWRMVIISGSGTAGDNFRIIRKRSRCFVSFKR